MNRLVDPHDAGKAVMYGQAVVRAYDQEHGRHAFANCDNDQQDEIVRLICEQVLPAERITPLLLLHVVAHLDRAATAAIWDDVDAALATRVLGVTA